MDIFLYVFRGEWESTTVWSAWRDNDGDFLSPVASGPEPLSTGVQGLAAPGPGPLTVERDTPSQVGTGWVLTPFMLTYFLVRIFHFQQLWSCTSGWGLNSEQRKQFLSFSLSLLKLLKAVGTRTFIQIYVKTFLTRYIYYSHADHVSSWFSLPYYNF